LTYKNGLVIGLVAGFIAWLLINGYLIFAPAPRITVNVTRLLASVFFVLALVFAFGSAYRRRSFVHPTVDGFVYGMVSVFDLIYVGNELLLGRLPLP